MSIPCDYGSEVAAWWVSTPDLAPVLVRSRFACDRHRGTAEAVVGDRGRRVSVTALADAGVTA